MFLSSSDADNDDEVLLLWCLFKDVWYEFRIWYLVDVLYLINDSPISVVIQKILNGWKITSVVHLRRGGLLIFRRQLWNFDRFLSMYNGDFIKIFNYFA